MPMRWFDSDIENYERGGCGLAFVFAAGVLTAAASVLLHVVS